MQIILEQPHFLPPSPHLTRAFRVPKEEGKVWNESVVKVPHTLLPTTPPPHTHTHTHTHAHALSPLPLLTLEAAIRKSIP